MQISEIELAKFLDSLEGEFGLTTDDLLWHYTDTRGLEGIVNTGTIRFSHLGFLNDPSELQYAEEVYASVLSEPSSEQDPLRGEFITGYLDFKDNLQQQFGETMTPTPFVTSFCIDCDNLDLWRQYADDGQGFALGFRMKELREILNGENLEIRRLIHGFRVLYDTTEQQRLISRILGYFLSKFLEIHTAGETTDLTSSSADVYTGFLVTLDTFAPIFKHPCYASEKEGRLIWYGDTIDLDEAKYLARRGFFKPYIDLNFKTRKEEKPPLAAVVAGPATDPLICEKSLRMFLNNHGLSDVQISRSALPYRGNTSLRN